MHFAVNIEWWQLVIGALYLLVGGLVCAIGKFANDLERGMGSAFGYPSSRFGLVEGMALIFLWPLALLGILLVLVLVLVRWLLLGRS